MAKGPQAPGPKLGDSLIAKITSCLLQSSGILWLSFERFGEERQGQSQMEQRGKASRRVEGEMKEKITFDGSGQNGEQNLGNFFPGYWNEAQIPVLGFPLCLASHVCVFINPPGAFSLSVKDVTTQGEVIDQELHYKIQSKKKNKTKLRWKI